MYLLGRYKIIPEIQFLNRMAICFGLCLVVMYLIARARPLPQPIEFRQQSTLDLRSSKVAMVFGVLIILITIALYVLFSPIGLAG
jgi:SSS family solute:Na+ symporter